MNKLGSAAIIAGFVMVASAVDTTGKNVNAVTLTPNNPSSKNQCIQPGVNYHSKKWKTSYTILGVYNMGQTTQVYLTTAFINETGRTTTGPMVFEVNSNKLNNNKIGSIEVHRLIYFLLPISI